MIEGYKPECRDSGFRKLVKTVNLDDFRKICYFGCDLILIEIENNKSLFLLESMFLFGWSRQNNASVLFGI